MPRVRLATPVRCSAQAQAAGSCLRRASAGPASNRCFPYRRRRRDTHLPRHASNSRRAAKGLRAIPRRHQLQSGGMRHALARRIWHAAGWSAMNGVSWDAVSFPTALAKSAFPDTRNRIYSEIAAARPRRPTHLRPHQPTHPSINPLTLTVVFCLVRGIVSVTSKAERHVLRSRGVGTRYSQACMLCGGSPTATPIYDAGDGWR